MISVHHDMSEVIDSLNAIGKSFIFQLMPIVQLTAAKGYDTHMVMHTGTCASDVSLAREFKKHTCRMRNAKLERFIKANTKKVK